MACRSSICFVFASMLARVPTQMLKTKTTTDNVCRADASAQCNQPPLPPPPERNGQNGYFVYDLPIVVQTLCSARSVFPLPFARHLYGAVFRLSQASPAEI